MQFFLEAAHIASNKVYSDTLSLSLLLSELPSYSDKIALANISIRLVNF